MKKRISFLMITLLAVIVTVISCSKNGIKDAPTDGGSSALSLSRKASSASNTLISQPAVHLHTTATRLTVFSSLTHHIGVTGMMQIRKLTNEVTYSFTGR